MIVTDERVAQFISARTGCAFTPPYTLLGSEKDGEIINGVLFNCFEGADIHFSVAGTGWTKGFLRAVGEYVFGQLGSLRMTATTENPEVVRLAEKLGGKIEGRLRDHFGPGRDGIIIGILRNEWRYGKVATE